MRSISRIFDGSCDPLDTSSKENALGLLVMASSGGGSGREGEGMTTHSDVTESVESVDAPLGRMVDDESVGLTVEGCRGR